MKNTPLISNTAPMPWRLAGGETSSLTSAQTPLFLIEHLIRTERRTNLWEWTNALVFLKVTDEEGDVWFVAKMRGRLPDAYLIIPSDIADKSLRREGVTPDVEVIGR